MYVTNSTQDSCLNCPHTQKLSKEPMFFSLHANIASIAKAAWKEAKRIKPTFHPLMPNLAVWSTSSLCWKQGFGVFQTDLLTLTLRSIGESRRGYEKRGRRGRRYIEGQNSRNVKPAEWWGWERWGQQLRLTEMKFLAVLCLRPMCGFAINCYLSHGADSKAPDS